MKKTKMWAVVAWAAVAVGLLAPPSLRGQGDDQGAATAQAPQHFYKLNLMVEEVNDAGKPTNVRTFMATIATPGHHSQQIRTGARIPISITDNQWQYLDVGVNFDVSEPREVGDKLAINLNAEISSLATPETGGAGSASHPVVRQNRWSSNVVIPVGKPTVVFSADDLDSKGKMQVELTATRVE